MRVTARPGRAIDQVARHWGWGLVVWELEPLVLAQERPNLRPQTSKPPMALPGHADARE